MIGALVSQPLEPSVNQHVSVVDELESLPLKLNNYGQHINYLLSRPPSHRYITDYPVHNLPEGFTEKTSLQGNKHRSTMVITGSLRTSPRPTMSPYQRASVARSLFADACVRDPYETAGTHSDFGLMFNCLGVGAVNLFV